MDRRLAAGVLAVAALALAPASPALASTLQPLRSGERSAFPEVRDVLLPAASAGARRAARATGRGGERGRPRARAAAQATYTAADGTQINVDISPAYGQVDPARVQTYVDFLASRAHGPELSELTLLIVTPAEVQQRYCAPTALACYAPSLEVMIVPGEETPAGEAPLDYVITHELGHHVANNRRNDPWPAIAYGPKRWASLRGVCVGVREGRDFPADQGEHYFQNPGENWAETYAVMHYRTAPWTYDPSFTPDEPTFAAALADVALPWQRPAAARRHGSLSRAKKSKTFPVATTLDGRITLRLSGPRAANYDLELRAGGQPLRRTHARGARDELNYDACGLRTLEARVTRRSGSGRFTLRVGTPG